MIRATLVFAVLGLVVPNVASAQDHLQCFKVRDPLKLAAVVQLDSPQFGLTTGCKVLRAQLFCVPATKSVSSAIDKATGLPINLLPIGGPDPGDRICYKVKCPSQPIPDQVVSDQFGTRTIGKFKTSLLCTPAIKGVPTTTTTTTTTTSTTTTTLGCTNCCPSAPANCGDLDCDGCRDSDDADLLQMRILAGTSPSDCCGLGTLACGDLNQSSVIDVGDLVILATCVDGTTPVMMCGVTCP